MKKLYFLAAAILAAFCLAACDEKNPEEGGPDNGMHLDDNWWFHNNCVKDGIKSIAEDDGTTWEFDKNGRLITLKSQWVEETYTYNSDGLPSQIVTKEYSDGKVTDTITEVFEYKNKGKFCPIQMNPGFIFHIFEMGLVPNLSKITWTGNEIGTVVAEYTFNGDKLTVKTTGGKGDYTYEDFVMEYKGNYPYQTRNDMEFMGPFTFQENGMFDTYKEGFLYEGVVTTDRTITVDKGFKDKMVPAQMVSYNYNAPDGDLWNVETVDYTYNEHGDCTKEHTTNTCSGCDDYTANYEYEYDSKGNWTKCTSTSSSRPGETFTRTRTILYY